MVLREAQGICASYEAWQFSRFCRGHKVLSGTGCDKQFKRREEREDETYFLKVHR